MQASSSIASSGLTDEALLAGLGVGDRDAAVVFVRRFQRRVYGLAYSLLGDPELAQDIAQEAMSRAWRHAETYDPRRGSVAAWLLTIARNLAINSLRVHRAEPIDPGSLLITEASLSGPRPDEALVSADDAARVRAALARIPVEQRRAVVLASFQGCTAKEISEVEGIPLGTAKTRIRSGLLRLRAIMTQEVVEEEVW